MTDERIIAGSEKCMQDFHPGFSLGVVAYLYRCCDEEQRG